MSFIKEKGMSFMIRSAQGDPECGHPDDAGALLLSAHALIGNKVFNRKDEYLGDIRDLVLNGYKGNVCYAVVSAGGFLGMGEKLHPVPWGALSLDAGITRFVLDLDVDRFKDAPGFDKDEWPNMADAGWARRIHSYYGIHGDPVKPNVPPA
ncbi:MAG TPA: PRC-barrel domain-containing protein [Rhodocyclaceae bacterium]|nr:PRC-barrel domain-containing protein [Rhodocyclaceae bacterium]HRQ47604.1 PRC-barrel domain-containing protein [Rhodocyclaceae bacterium]